MYFVATTLVSGHECTNTVAVGSLRHDNITVNSNQTFILAGYTIPCSGIAIAWEFCYHTSGSESVTFYPGVWRATGTMDDGTTEYELVQSSKITYNSTGNDSNKFPCDIFKLSAEDQFTVQENFCIGLYSGIETQLLLTNNTDRHPKATYGNRSKVDNINKDVNYEIAIKVHLGKSIFINKIM